VRSAVRYAWIVDTEAAWMLAFPMIVPMVDE
jgi:hypothetical protein